MRLLIFFLFLTTTCLAHVHPDSLKVASLFDSLLRQPEQGATINKALEKYLTKCEKGDEKLGRIYYYHFGKYLIQSAQLDSVLAISKKGLVLAKNDPTGKWKVKFLNLQGSYYSLKQDYPRAIESFKRSLKICESTGDPIQAAYINNNIANLFFSLLDYKQAHTYSEKAYQTIKNYGDDPYYSSILAVHSVAEAKIGHLYSARKLANRALLIGTKNKDLLSQIIANYALGDIENKAGHYNSAEAYFLASLEISEQLARHHYTLLNHLGLQQTYLSTKQFDKALESGERALALSHVLDNRNIDYSLLKNLARAYHGIGNEAKAYKLLAEAHSIYLATADVQRQEAINEILIKYDSEKKEKEITRNKLLLAEKDLQSSRAKIWIVTLIGILLILSIGAILFRNRARIRLRHLKLKHETETLYAILNGEEQERNRLSDELHDGIASQLTTMRLLIEELPEHLKEKERLHEMLINTHIDTRRVARNLAPRFIEENGLTGALKQYAEENSSGQIKIQFLFTGIGKTFSQATQLFLYRAVQEFVQNAMKHGKPTEIIIQLLQDKDHVRCVIENDGHGFDLALITHNGGLNHLKDRIEHLGGELHIDSSVNSAGTIVTFGIPLSNL